MHQKELKKTIEAALFMSPQSVSVNDLAKLTNTTVAETRVVLTELIQDYEERDTSLEILDDSSGIKIVVKAEFQDIVSHFAAAPEFNKGIMKTLAYVSYKQPVKQTEVIKFRNNKGYDHIKMLEERGFIRREPVGRSYVIYTTKKFLDYFGKKSKLE